MWHGPSWLRKPQLEWPEPLNVRAMKPTVEAEEEIKLNVQAVSVRKDRLFVFVKGLTKKKNRVPLIEYSMNLEKITRILAFVQRFIRLCRDKTRPKPIKPININQSWEHLVELTTSEERRRAMECLIREEQRIFFNSEYAHLLGKISQENDGAFPSKSSLLQLHPFMDKEGIIRAGGRLGGSELPYDTKYPVIIPPKSNLSLLISWSAHKATEHGGAQVMMQYIRASYWIPRLRQELRYYINKCAICIRYTNNFESQLMSELPTDRVRANRPFLISGLDYAGPFLLSERYGMSTKNRKCWVAIYVCMVTRV